MRDSIKNAVGETVQDLINSGFKTSFTKKELNELGVLRLKLPVTRKPPKTRYPVAGLPSGAGFPPAELHDLARPHKYGVPGFCPRIYRYFYKT